MVADQKQCVPVKESPNWHTVIIAILLSLMTSSCTLFQHSMFPHKDAAHKAEVLLVYDQLRDLRADMKVQGNLLNAEIKSLTKELVRLRESISNNTGR